MNFPIVPEQGRLQITRIALYDAHTGDPISCANCTRQDTFRFIQPPELRLVLIGYRFRAGGRLVTPREIDFDAIEQWIGRNYPVAAPLRVSRRLIDADPLWDGTCESTNRHLMRIRAADREAGVHPRTYYYGLVSDEYGFRRGCASAIPSSPDASVVASGPAGPPTRERFNWDTDGSYADWYAGHEIGHMLGRKHVNEKCPGRLLDLDYPFEPGTISDRKAGFVGWDMRSAPGRRGPVLKGEEWHDVMSYCERQWMSAHTYRRLLKWLTVGEKSSSTPLAAPLLGAGAALAGAPAPQDTVRWVLLSAVVDTIAGTGSILGVTATVPERGAPRPPFKSTAVVRVHDAAGAALSSAPAMLLESTRTGPSGGRRTIQHLLRLDTSASVVQLVLAGAVVDSLVLGRSSPWIEGVEVSQATAAEGRDGVVFTWQPAAADTAAGLTYTVRVWFGDAGIGETMATGLREPRLVLDDQQQMGRTITRVEVVASNGTRIGTFRSTRLCAGSESDC